MRNTVSGILRTVGPLALSLALAGVIAPSSAFARGGGHGGGHGGGGHGGGHYSGYGRGYGRGYGYGGGWGWAGGLGWGAYAPWGWPGYYYPYQTYAYTDDEPVAPAATVMQQASPAMTVAQPYYYCDNPRGYYPYISACQTPWRPVPQVPPPGQ